MPEREGRGAATPVSAHASLDTLLDLCGRYMIGAELDLLRHAYDIAAKAHAGVVRRSGEPYIEHPVAVATILAELAIDAPGIAAALLHDTVEDTSLTLDDVRAEFGPTIASIVDGVTKFSAVEPTPSDAESSYPRGQKPVPPAPLDPQAIRAQKAREQAETVRKLFLAMVSDPRVVLVKLADRLHNLRTMAVMSPNQRAFKAREALEVYAPLASRIGLHNVKSELEDWSFAYLQPEEREYTVQRLREEQKVRQGWIDRMCEITRRELADSGITAAVNWRLKQPRRAWVEARESGLEIGQLHDLIAFRVLVETTEQCYRALGIIHRLWHPYSERIRDYIASPKVNGYQSLHTSVFALDGRLANMHIRTHDMHRASQHGIAMYWLRQAETHAGNRSGQAGLNVWAQELPMWVKQVAHWQEELRLSAAEFVETLHDELFEDQVFVFTPKGQVRELPVGSTVLDFAYQIHTDVGSHATGARIQTNDASDAQDMLVSRHVGLDYMPRTGDIVEVTTDAETHPQPEWLALANTRYARERIARALRMQQRAAEVSLARADSLAPENPPALRHPSGKLAEASFARCCYPIAGDAVVGLAASDGKTVVVHRACCRTLHAALTRRREADAKYAKPVPVRWQQLQTLPYRLLLAIYSQDHSGLMHEVSDCVAQMGLNVSRSRAITHPSRFKAAIVIVLDIPPGMRRDVLLRRLRNVPGVTRVEREASKGCDQSLA